MLLWPKRYCQDLYLIVQKRYLSRNSILNYFVDISNFCIPCKRQQNRTLVPLKPTSILAYHHNYMICTERFCVGFLTYVVFSILLAYNFPVGKLVHQIFIISTYNCWISIGISQKSQGLKYCRICI